MKLIIGLGNPGEKYAHTRHNLGFMVIDAVAAHLKADSLARSKHLAHITKVKLQNEATILAKPDTFMNDSGKSVTALMNFFKLPPSSLLVIHDEIDLPFGRIKIEEGRGSAGHNGVQSVIDHLGTQNFSRLRIGVGNAQLRTPIDPSDFVLSRFSAEEQQKLPKVIERAAQLIISG